MPVDRSRWDQEKQRAARARYREKNRDAIRAHDRATPRSVERAMLSSAKKRAAKKGVPFEITLADIHVPPVCPVLGIPLIPKRGTGGAWANSPTLDRRDPALGYVPGNVAVISHRANAIKHDATRDEILRVAEWLRN